jgi:beta-phosphoglucomutase
MVELNKAAVIFDLDGVITDTSVFHLKTWNNLAKSIGIELTEEYLDSLKGIDRMQSLQLILDFGKQDISDDEKHRLAEQKNRAYLQEVEKITPANLLPGALELLDYLRNRQVKIALASSSKNALLVLKKLAIEPYFDFVVDPARLKNGKPAPEIFLKAAEGVQILPEYSIGIEDAVAGVESINAAGMFSIGVGNEKELAEADLVVADLTRLNNGGKMEKLLLDLF